MVQGQTLDAAIADFLSVDTAARPEEELAAYIASSRVREADALLIARAFSPHLFTHGEMLGPHLLLEVMRGNLPKESRRAL